jgi:cell division transport system permease protein
MVGAQEEGSGRGEHVRSRFILGEVGTGLRRNISMAASVILVTMVSVFLLGLGLLAQRQADTMKGYWYDRIQVSIFLCNVLSVQPNCQGQSVTEAQRATIKAQLEAMPEVKEVYYESEQQAFDRFKEQMRNSPVVNNLKVGDIPQSFRVQLKDPTKFAVVTSQFEGAPGVASVQDQQKVLRPLFTVIDVVTWIAVVLAAAMVLCATLLMGTTIRQAAFTRRREIAIMRLVGASSMTIRMPFIVEMLIVSILGVALAGVALWVLLYFVFDRRLSQMSGAWIGTADLWVLTPWMVLGAALVAALTSIVALRRFLRI